MNGGSIDRNDVGDSAKNDVGGSADQGDVAGPAESDVTGSANRSEITESGGSERADGWPPATATSAASEPVQREEPSRPLNEVTASHDRKDNGVDAVVPTGGDDGNVTGSIADGGPRVGKDLLHDHSFALCLTHDVDRPYKVAQAVFYALRDRDPGQLRALLPGHRPNWTFDRLMAIESELGVRSAFYFLDEQRLFHDRPLRDWFDLDAWRLYADRYAVDDPPIVELIGRLDRGGWEVGLHGSYESYDDRGRLRREKERLESVLGRPVRGGRQHYLNRTLPDTWEHHAALGLSYDATLGSSSEIGFDYGDTIGRPFDDAFVTFPLAMMDVAMPDPGVDLETARTACDRVLEAAAERGAISTVLWHPRVFNREDWPGHTTLYRHLIERALELGAWVGPPRELYDRLEHPA